MVAGFAMAFDRVMARTQRRFVGAARMLPIAVAIGLTTALARRWFGAVALLATLRPVAITAVAGGRAG